jgi:hypothetical protein
MQSAKPDGLMETLLSSAAGGVGILIVVAGVIAIATITKKPLKMSYKHFSFELGSVKTVDPLAQKDLLPFQRQMLLDVEERRKMRNEGILKMHYEIPLRWEFDFLNRVIALYEGATAVHAVTLSSISRFWISEDDRDGIIDYLQCQRGKEIYRLFVFATPFDLFRYEEVLQANYESYGKSGGLFVTSLQAYQTEILPAICDRSQIDQLLQQDFGVWDYGKVSILATLDQEQTLEFEKIEHALPKGIRVAPFKESFRGGQHVVAWTRDTSITDVFHQLFGEHDQVGMVLHIVLLKHADDGILDEISAVMLGLDEIREKARASGSTLNFCDPEPWWGINVQKLNGGTVFTDPQSGGRLTCDAEYKYALVIRLPSLDDLRAWYQFEDHSTIRREVYCKLMGSIEAAYVKLNGLLALDRARCFDQIEGEIINSGYLRRMDFISSKPAQKVSRFKIIQKFRSTPPPPPVS